MKRLLSWAAFVYIMGILLAMFFEMNVIVWMSIFLLLVGIIKCLISRNSCYYALILLICILGGCWRFNIMTEALLNPIHEYIDQPITFICRISDLPTVKGKNIQYNAQVETVQYRGKKVAVDTKIRLICSNESKESFLYGDTLQVTSKLYYPSHSFNEGGFDYNYYLRTKGIYAVCFAAPYQIKRIEKNMRVNTLIDLCVGIRYSVMSIIDRFLPADEAALLKGMMLGIRDGFSEEMKEEFSKTGLAHLTAVSGMHVAIFVGGVIWLLSIAGINKYLINIAGIIFIILFIIITGCTPSVLRAGLMAVIFLLAFLVNREPDAVTSLSTASLVILIYNPLNLLNVGFQLSFCATISLLIFYKPIHHRLKVLPKMVREIAAASVSAQIGTVMITAYHFNSISIVGILGNLIIVPMVSFALFGGLGLYLLGSVSAFAGKIAAGFCYILLKFILMMVHFIAALPISAVRVPSPNVSMVICYLLIVFILYNLIQETKNTVHIKIALLVLAIVVGTGTVAGIYNGKDLEVVFVNVGQGDCTLIRCPDGRNIIIDGGGNEGESEYDIGRNIVIPYLLKKGVMQIDMAVVSHYHDDHAEGILSIMEEMPVKLLLLPQRKNVNSLMQRLIKTAQQHNVPVYNIEKGTFIDMGKGITMEALYPDVNQVDSYPEDEENNRSLVLALRHEALRFLFTGDIEKEAESYLIRQGIGLKTDVIKVPHHGSDTSLTDDFLTALAPKYAVISVGRNSFGHPAEVVLERLMHNHVKVYRTDINGTITFVSDGRSIKDVRLYREGE
ncbi:DNA internalization-related competence protein ComEC/Rec2 [Petroclostridium sp. X23]|uniref:DNA internalization-related competence protein ComEC/Rec2 n=1 Tax=Petroclostridium sp. X23 TaxID=3045146 RepID=UPI0024AD88B3|nr:DNA internalization-related competence protein ComEC/Rec2 [Petroclostridium sp. X23]WHH60437.1 DNA internalization-related competence protein ComEC/Rec2 [Petroclostridium sp. X23]